MAGQTTIRAESANNPLYGRRLRTDLGRPLGNNSSDRLVKPMQEVAKSPTRTSSKRGKFKSYNDAVNIQSIEIDGKKPLMRSLRTLDSH